MFYEYLWYSDFLAVFLRSLKHAFDCLSGKRHGHFSSSHVPNVANIPYNNLTIPPRRRK